MAEHCTSSTTRLALQRRFFHEFACKRLHIKGKSWDPARLTTVFRFLGTLRGRIEVIDDA